MMTKTAIVVPNWNGADFISECLRSLLVQTQKSVVIVVDNGSSDNSVELIEKKFPSVTLIKLPKNTGFTGGVNTGIKEAKKLGCAFVALFNNDAVAKKDWLEHLLGAIDSRPTTGIVTGKFMRDDKIHIDSTGDIMSIYGLPFPRGRNEKDEGQYETGEYVFGATGGASLYRMSMLDKIGLFDEDFFAYFEDVELSFRAQLSGWKVFYEPRAVAYHKVGATSSKMGSFARYHSVKNAILLYNRTMPGILYWKYKLPFMVFVVSRMFVGSLRDRQLSPYIKAVARAAWLIPKTLLVRRRIQKARTVSIEYIDGMLYHKRPPRPKKL